MTNPYTLDSRFLIAEYLFNDDNQGQQPIADRTFEDSATANDGIAQTGTNIGSANTLNGPNVLDLDGHDDAVLIAPSEAFQIDQGAISLKFNQDAHVGSSPDTLISRDSANLDDGGHLTIQVTRDGEVTVRHQTDSESFFFETPSHFFSEGDDVHVFYQWDVEGVDGKFVVQNLTTGAEYSEDIDEKLTINMGDDFNEPWTIGASQAVSGDNKADNLREFFNGQIDNVRIYDVGAGAKDGLVEGSGAGERIDANFLGDPEGDLIDSGDALLPGEGPDDDIVLAGGGNDTVFSGDGDDDIFGGSGNEEIWAGKGDDVARGESGNDWVHGQDGDDILLGGTGNDMLFGEKDDDTLLGGTGNDSKLSGGDGDDVVAGGAGNDLVLGGSGDDTLTGGGGDDTIEGSQGEDVIDGGAGDDDIWAGLDDDTASGGDGDDTIDGGASGDDFLEGNGGNDSIDGQSGNDTIFGDNSSDGAPVRELFQWSEADGFGDDEVAQTFAQNTGSTTIVFDVLTNNIAEVETQFEETLQNTVDLDPAVGSNSSLESVLNGPDNTATYSWTSTQPLENVEFRINDIDGSGQVTVRAFDENGNAIEVILSDAGAGLSLSNTDGVPGNDTATSVDFDFLPDAADEHSVLVTIPGPVSRWEVEHNQLSTPNTGVNFTDIAFDVPTAFGDDGDDVINGGSGEDSIFGQGGDDTIDAGADNDTVSGGEGNDEVSGGTGDDEIFGDAGDDELFGNDGDDTVDGGEGDDTIFGQDGSDSLLGGAGNDSLIGGQDGDTLDGGEGNDTIDGFSGDDEIFGGTGDDEIVGGGGDDTIEGNEGNDDITGGNNVDVIDGGSGDDTITAGFGGDTVAGGIGNDSILGEGGDDVIDAGVFGLPDLGYPGIFPADPIPDNDLDFVDGGAGDDDIRTGDDNDTILGGTGNDSIDGGFDQDEIEGGDGDDRIVGGEGSDSIDAGDGDDTVFAGIDPALGLPDNLDIADDDGDLVTNNGKDTVDGGAGDDVIFGADDDDVIDGGADDDFIDGGVDDDLIEGGSGDDTIIGGEGEDTLSGGDGEDIFKAAEFTPGGDPVDPADNQGTFIGDVVDGGAGPVDFDILDLRGTVTEGGRLKVTETGPDSNGNGADGFVEYFDGDDNLLGTLQFEEIEQVIVCFTPGTSIATPRGEVAVESLKPGDRVVTRDNGLQEIAWTGARELSEAEMAAANELRPVLIKAGSLGPNLPERDMIVSPQHRMLIASDRTQLYFDEREVLVAAKHLVGLDGVTRMGNVDTTYIHFMCQKHEVVLSDGAWTETFQPGDYSLGGIGDAARDEIVTLFPELATEKGLKDYTSARKSLKRHEATLITTG